jgi:hypothetical protein
MTHFIVGRKHRNRIAARITLQAQQKGVVLDGDARADRRRARKGSLLNIHVLFASC